MPKVPPNSQQLKREAVKLLRDSGRAVPQMAKELGVSEGSLRNWVAQSDVDEGKAEGLSSTSARSCAGCDARSRSWPRSARSLKNAAAFFAAEGKHR